MSKKNIAHFTQWDSTPNIELILQDLIKEEYVPSYINPKDWVAYAHEIISSIKENLDKVNSRRTIKLTLNIFDITIDNEENRFSRMFDNEDFDIIEEHNKNIVKEVLLKKFSIERAIIEILNDNLHLWRTSLIWYRRSYNLLANIKWINKLDRTYDGIRRKDKNKVKATLDSIDINNINSELDKILKKSKKWNFITISLSTREFLSSFVSRIDIFKDVIEKTNLIEVFEERKQKKVVKSRWFLWTSFFLFSVILWSNIYFFSKYFQDERIIEFWEFIKHFFWHNIYFFTSEIFLIFLAFYFLSLFKSYLKIIELYDSHILLIESDFFYKNDDHFQGDNHKDELFKMRKENAQKIHMLPEKTFDILNWKEQIKDSPNTTKAIENIFESIKSILPKK